MILNFLLVGAIFAEGFHVCVASYKNLENAETMVEKLEKQSVSAFVSESKTKNQTLYRVLLSKEFKNTADARKYRDEVQKYSFVRELGLKDFWVCKSEKVILKNYPLAVGSEKTKSPKVAPAPAPVQKIAPKIEPIPEPKVIEKPKPAPKKEIPPKPLPIPEEPKVDLIPITEPPVKNIEKEPAPLPEPEPAPLPEIPLVEEVEPPLAETKILDKNDEKAVLSEETPYSVLVRSYKYAQFAENDKNRLYELGFEPYLLNTFDEKSFFAFNIHVGAFETREEAEELKAQFDDAGIFDTEVSDFREIEDKIKKYDEVLSRENVTFDDGLSEFPTSLPSSVEKVVKHFPANKDFPIQEITIVDYDNFLASSYKPSISSPIFDYVHGESSGVHAALSAVYRDELYGKEVSVFFANADQLPTIDALGEFEFMQFESNDGFFDCQLYEYAGETVLSGANVDENLFVRISTKDFTKEEFINFLIDSFNDKSLVLYPQMRRTFFVLPDENPDVERDFVAFTYKKITDDYASERNYAEWAVPIVGHSLAKTYFSEKDSFISLGFYDLDYDFNAKNVHVHFTEAKTSAEISPTNQPVSVKGAEGWYLVNPSQKEVSFSTKSYVIAIDTDPNNTLEKDDLIRLGTDLKIWE